MKPKMYLVNLRSRSDKFIFFVHESLIDWIDSVEINKSSESVIIPDNILNTHLAENPTAEVIKSSFMMSRINGFNDLMIL